MFAAPSLIQPISELELAEFLTAVWTEFRKKAAIRQQRLRRIFRKTLTPNSSGS
jgi:hypothetical protein